MRRHSIRFLLASALCVYSTLAFSESWVLVEGGSWVPDSSVISNIKATLEGHVKNVATERKWKIRKWESYTFQYQGVTVGGQNLVFVNALCIRHPEWRLEKQIVRVLDGGTCFFNIKFDPKRGQYLEFFVNGEA